MPLFPRLNFDAPTRSAAAAKVVALDANTCAAIETELRTRGLDGSQTWPSPAAALQQAVDVLRSYCVRPSPGLDWNSVLPSSRGGVSVAVARGAAQLVLRWRATRRGYIVEAYLV